MGTKLGCTLGCTKDKAEYLEKLETYEVTNEGKCVILGNQEDLFSKELKNVRDAK